MKKSLLIQSLLAVAAAASARPAPAAPIPAVRHPGCWNKPRPTAETTHVAQAGWLAVVSAVPSRMPRMVTVPHRMSTTCKYDKSGSDPGCAGCQHGSAP